MDSFDQLASIKSLVHDDLVEVDQLISNSLDSDVSLAGEINHYIVESGGKRIRPILVLLSAKAFNYQGKDHITLAAIIELLHTATLLHDDVIDHSKLRRGKPTVNVRWGEQASILTGDLLHARSFQLIAKMNNPTVVNILAAATSVIVEGELLQLSHCHDVALTEAIYWQIIGQKTGKLFEVAAQTGPLLMEASSDVCEAMATYGYNLGCVFQLLDDALDYVGDEKKIGKKLGEDICEGKPSLAFIYILTHGSKQDKALIKEVLADSDVDGQQLKKVIQAVVDSGALAYIKKRAYELIAEAKDKLDVCHNVSVRNALLELSDFCCKRSM